MAATYPTRIDNDLYASAKLVGGLQDRSAAQQLSHWARVGREIEAASVSHRAIADVLTHRRDYDSLTVREQAVVRAEWEERIAERRDSCDLTGILEAAGASYVEVDRHGNVTTVPVSTTR
jgi:hypothetical protein